MHMPLSSEIILPPRGGSGPRVLLKTLGSIGVTCIFDGGFAAAAPTVLTAFARLPLEGEGLELRHV